MILTTSVLQYYKIVHQHLVILMTTILIEVVSPGYSTIFTTYYYSYYIGKRQFAISTGITSF